MIFLLKIFLIIILFFLGIYLTEHRTVKEFHLLDCFFWTYFFLSSFSYLNNQMSEFNFLFLILFLFGSKKSLPLMNRYIPVKKIVKPHMIIQNGILNFKEIDELEISLDLLLEKLKEKGIDDISKVECAYLDYDGNLVVGNTYSNCPVLLMVQNQVNFDNLKKIGKTKEWLFESLFEKGLKTQDISFGFYFQENLIFITTKTLKKDASLPF